MTALGLPAPEESDDEEFLTAWERNFLGSIAQWEGDLTYVQRAKLTQIEAALEERREAWRRAEEIDPGSGERWIRLGERLRRQR
jgi:hypothetical protein